MSVELFKIRLNLDTLKEYRSGTITGHFHIQVGRKVLPEFGWYGFPVEFINELMSAIGSLDEPNDEAIVSFMGGPDHLNIRRSFVGGCLGISSNDDGVEELVICNQLEEEIEETIMKLIAAIKEKGFAYKTVQKLINKIQHEQ